MNAPVDRRKYQDRVPLLRAQLESRHADPVAWSRERVAATQLSLGTALFYGYADAAGARAAWLAAMDAAPSAMALQNLETLARRAGDAAAQRRSAALRALLFPGAGPAVDPPPGAAAGDAAAKPNLAIYTGYSAPFTAASVGARPVYGSEIAAVKLATALAAEGTFRVTVFCPCNGEEEPDGVDGATYLHLSQYDAWSRAYAVDTLIVSRYLHFFLEFIPRAARVALWLHDLAPHYLWSDKALPAMGSAFFANVLPMIDHVVCVSPWHAGALLDWLAAQHCPDSAIATTSRRLCVIGNAIDPADLPAQPIPRVPGRFIYCIDPDRGLSPLLSMFARIRAVRPECTLHVHWSHLSDAHLAQLQATAGAEFRGRLPPPELAAALAAAELMLYPNLGHETFSLAALEAQAAGCVVICRDYSALSTTVGDDSGIKLPGEVTDGEWQDRAVAEALELLAGDRLRLRELSRRAMEWARPQTWARRVAADWMPRVLRAKADE